MNGMRMLANILGSKNTGLFTLMLCSSRCIVTLMRQLRSVALHSIREAIGSRISALTSPPRAQRVYSGNGSSFVSNFTLGTSSKVGRQQDWGANPAEVAVRGCCQVCGG